MRGVKRGEENEKMMKMIEFKLLKGGNERDGEGGGDGKGDILRDSGRLWKATSSFFVFFG